MLISYHQLATFAIPHFLISVERNTAYGVFLLASELIYPQEFSGADSD